MAVTLARVTSPPQAKTRPHRPGKGGAAAAGLRDLAIAHPFGPVQAQLTVSQPTDALEVEADHAAEQAMGMTGPAPLARSQPLVQRRCAECERELFERFRQAEDEPILQRQASSSSHQRATGSEIVARQLGRLENGGSPLPGSARSFFEPRFGHGFDAVRVHTGPEAEDAARSINAKAFTYGRHIVFGPGQFSPDTHGGRKLLAHELAHTVQQGAGAPHAIQRTIGDGHDLQAPRFALNVELEKAFDGELTIGKGSPHTVAVRLIQQSLVDQGYTLPGFGVDGIFGDETEAAIKVFQREAGAALIDGIVGRETMGLLDLHDVTRLGGPGPVPSVGPRPGPRPPPAPGCAAPFTGVTFTLANTRGAGATPAANIRVVTLAGGIDFFRMSAIDHAHWDPDVTINAPSDPVAQQFQVGFASNVLSENLVYTYSNGVTIRSTLPTPIKDGRALSSGSYDPVYVEQPTPNILESFAAAGDTVHLNWPDVPSDGAAVQTTNNPECAAGIGAGDLTHAVFQDTFRTWVVARHIGSGCTQSLHHIDWDLHWEATIVHLPILGFFALPIANAINVTVADGDGTPAFIQGGPVPDDLLAANRICA